MRATDPHTAALASPARVVGWDVGGAHLKACLLERGVVVDVAQWACPLWQGLQHLHAALGQARERWPHALHDPQAVTMTGEMTDLFTDRQDGVQRLTDALQSALPGPVRVYAGPHAQDPRRSQWAQPHEAFARHEHLPRNHRLQAVEIGQPVRIGLIGPGEPQPLHLIANGRILDQRRRLDAVADEV